MLSMARPAMNTLPRVRKICIHEMQVAGNIWVQTGRRMYVDPDAPLNTLAGWDRALTSGQVAVPVSTFSQIAQIVESALKKGHHAEDD